MVCVGRRWQSQSTALATVRERHGELWNAVGDGRAVVWSEGGRGMGRVVEVVYNTTRPPNGVLQENTNCASA